MYVKTVSAYYKYIKLKRCFFSYVAFCLGLFSQERTIKYNGLEISPLAMHARLPFFSTFILLTKS